jgi:hypothetical protein
MPNGVRNRQRDRIPARSLQPLLPSGPYFLQGGHVVLPLPSLDFLPPLFFQKGVALAKLLPPSLDQFPEAFQFHGPLLGLGLVSPQVEPRLLAVSLETQVTPVVPLAVLRQTLLAHRRTAISGVAHPYPNTQFLAAIGYRQGRIGYKIGYRRGGRRFAAVREKLQVLK